MNQSEISITASEMLAMASPEAEISDEQLAWLEQLVDGLPWFSYAQLLLLKAIKQRLHSLFGERLPFASLYATSRERLHDYLQQVKDVSPQEQPYSAADVSLSPVAEELEVVPSDTAYEKKAEIQPVEQPPAAAAAAAAQPLPAARSEQLIDNFLTVQPQKVEHHFHSEKNMAPLAANGAAQDLVSETLADIYLAQGLLSKAKQVYAKLSLLYPEKKAYFAARLATASQQHTGHPTAARRHQEKAGA
ncbi:MAG: hypothetical protein LBF55_03075 [Prevotellaceae bacterium]|nr:hypothetical protein [Prevotellaceae bacterium]